MDSETKPTKPNLLLPNRGGRRALRLALITSGIVLSVIALLLVLTSLSSNKVIWLTPAELARSTQPGPFTTLKQKVKNLMGPVWRRIQRTRPQIAISSSLFTLSATSAEQIGLGNPTTTSADRMRAWILAPMESSALRQRLKTNSAASLLGSPGITTLNGGQARVVVGNTPAAVGVPGTGITIDLIPKTVSGSVKLTIAATSTERAEPLGNVPSVKTNFAMACQAVIPNGGSLVLEGGPPKDGSEKRYWLIVSPVLIDPQGKPIKP